MEEAFDRHLSDRIKEENDEFDIRIAGSISRLKGIERAVEGIL